MYETLTKFSLIHITTHLPVKAFRGVYVTRLYPLARDGVDVPSISISIASQVTTYAKNPGISSKSLSKEKSICGVDTFRRIYRLEQCRQVSKTLL